MLINLTILQYVQCSACPPDNVNVLLWKISFTVARTLSVFDRDDGK